MSEFSPEEQRIASLLKDAYSRVPASPSFKSRLLSRLMREGEDIRARKPRKLWRRPLVWAPAAVAIVVLVIIFAALGAPGQFPTPTPTGFLKILVTDAPPRRDVTEINVILSNVEVNRDENEDGGWITVFDGEQHFDLIKLRDLELAELLAKVELEAGTYAQIRIDVEIIDAEIDGKRDTGVMLPGGKLRMPVSFEIRESQTTVLTIDFDADKSLVFTGTDRVIFTPVVKLIVDYE